MHHRTWTCGPQILANFTQSIPFTEKSYPRIIHLSSARPAATHDLNFLSFTYPVSIVYMTHICLIALFFGTRRLLLTFDHLWNVTFPYNKAAKTAMVIVACKMQTSRDLKIAQYLSRFSELCEETVYSMGFQEYKWHLFFLRSNSGPIRSCQG
ncbi:hypothetical protein IW261DRAFT_1449559 [Armillaria novae-zelandiae]|uniref:Uncharacterized protein n=1 Tax=Armillaria novae-zelandiae TaxID=153914 RepID=A0AA39PQ51_9AGAR|nr:hypothetical protein IW261DRAFT_1449559 [Armillaria novae-zelandiae]